MSNHLEIIGATTQEWEQIGPLISQKQSVLLSDVSNRTMKFLLSAAQWNT